MEQPIVAVRAKCGPTACGSKNAKSHTAAGSDVAQRVRAAAEMRPEGMRPAFTKAGPAGWALEEGTGSVALSDFPRAHGSTAHLWSHTAARFLYISF